MGISRLEEEEEKNEDEEGIGNCDVVVELSDLLYHLTKEKPIEKILQEPKLSKEILLSTSKKLYTSIFTKIHNLNNNNNNNNHTILSLLSSSDKLYCNDVDDDDDDNDDDDDDITNNNNDNNNAEMIWEQIDVLNKDVLTLFSKNIKKMKKAYQKKIWIIILR